MKSKPIIIYTNGTPFLKHFSLNYCYLFFKNFMQCVLIMFASHLQLLFFTYTTCVLLKKLTQVVLLIAWGHISQNMADLP